MLKLQVYYLSKEKKSFKRVISYVNPAASDTDLKNFVEALNNLTTNQITEIFKIVNSYLEEDAPVYIDDGFIDDETLSAIWSGTYRPVFDADALTHDNIIQIWNGEYSPVNDEEPVIGGTFGF